MTELNVYRERRHIVEARLFDGTTENMMDVLHWVTSCGYVWYDMFTPTPPSGVTIDPVTGFLLITTEKGLETAQKGMYLVKGVNGRITPFDALIFDATYELDPNVPSNNESTTTPTGV